MKKTRDETEKKQAEAWETETRKPEEQRSSAASTWQDRLLALWDELNSRTGPAYDPAADPVWDGYTRTYRELGRQAMEDTMGKAASLTGGFISSYAMQQGSRAYEQYLQKLWDRLPELYSQVRSNYDRETDDLYRRFVQARQLYEYEQKTAQAAQKTLTAAQLNRLVSGYRQGGTAGIRDQLAAYRQLGYDLTPFYDVIGGRA